MKVDYLKEYLTTKQTEIDQYNKERNIDTTVALNGRRLTNLGVYRIYLTEYLKNHPAYSSRNVANSKTTTNN